MTSEDPIHLLKGQQYSLFLGLMDHNMSYREAKTFYWKCKTFITEHSVQIWYIGISTLTQASKKIKTGTAWGLNNQSLTCMCVI